MEEEVDWTRDPFPSDDRKIGFASGASKSYGLVGEGARGASARTVVGATIPGLVVERTDTVSQRVPTIVTHDFLAGITRMAFEGEIRGNTSAP